LSGVRGNLSRGGVELDLKKISQWRWSGVEVKTSEGGVEVEEKISNLGTLMQKFAYIEIICIIARELKSLF
jgi:hypothetical protein